MGHHCLSVFSPGLRKFFGADVATFAYSAGRLDRQLASQLAGVSTVAVTAVALIGWWWDLPPLSAWSAGSPTSSGALCLAAIGFALMRPRDDIVASVVGLVVVAVATAFLGFALFGAEREAGLEEAFAMPAATALGILLAGAAFMLCRFDRHYVTATVLGGLVGAVAVFGLLGNLGAGTSRRRGTGCDHGRGVARPRETTPVWNRIPAQAPGWHVSLAGDPGACPFRGNRA